MANFPEIPVVPETQPEFILAHFRFGLNPRATTHKTNFKAINPWGAIESMAVAHSATDQGNPASHVAGMSM